MIVFLDTNVVLDYLLEREDLIQRALILRANDFEDAIQYFSALQAGADCIVTRNVKDFSFSDIEVITPSDFLTKYFP